MCWFPVLFREEVAHATLRCAGWFQALRWGLDGNVHSGSSRETEVIQRTPMCACAGMGVGVHMCLHFGASWRFRTEDNLVPRLQAERSCFLSSGTKAGTHRCPNSSAIGTNTLLSGSWPLVKFRFSAPGKRLSLKGETVKLESARQTGTHIFRKYPSQRNAWVTVQALWPVWTTQIWLPHLCIDK